MDSGLFAKILKDLLADNDHVSLPGFGEFYVEDVPASFSDKGYTINPPYRKVCFRFDEKISPDALVEDLYAKANDIDRPTASKVVADYCSSLRKQLYAFKTVDLPLFGRLRQTRSGLVFFVPDENLAIFPQFDELEPISMKNMDIVPAPVPSASPVTDPETDASPEVEIDPDAVTDPEEEVSSKRHPRRTFAIVVLSVVLVIASFLVALAVVGRKYPDLVDPWLYNGEQLEILHTNMDKV